MPLIVTALEFNQEIIMSSKICLNYLDALQVQQLLQFNKSVGLLYIHFLSP
jgi:hypothetical protein